MLNRRINEYMYTATVTSQGQITIPIALRRALKLDRAQVIISLTKSGTLEIEPAPDFMDLQGSVPVTSSFDEEKLIEKAVLAEYKRTEKRLSNKAIFVG